MIITLAFAVGLGLYPSVARATDGEDGDQINLKKTPFLPLAALTVLDATIDVDSYGNSSTFIVQGQNHLFERGDFISVNNGQPQRVNQQTYSIVTPIAVDAAAGIATSCVMHNAGMIQVGYVHQLIKEAVGDNMAEWMIDTIITNISGQTIDVCLYVYADLDLFGSFVGDVGRFDSMRSAFLVNKPTGPPNNLFAFTDGSGRNSWQQATFPGLASGIPQRMSCTPLANSPVDLGPTDWTGAFQYMATLMPGESFTVWSSLVRLQ
jgi:hypothetical protein